MSKKANHYVDNKAFLEAIVQYKKEYAEAEAQGLETPRIPEYLGKCILDIATNLSYKANFVNYTFREEMVLDAIENCLTYFRNFDPAKSSNPFAYFTQISYYAFIRRIQKEKRDQNAKYRYISSLDLSEFLTQEGDDGEYSNNFINFLKKQIDIANRELASSEETTPKPKRKPKYLSEKKESDSGVLPLDD